MSAFGEATGYPGAPPGTAYGLPAFGWQRQSPSAWVPGRAMRDSDQPPFFDASSLVGRGMMSVQQTLGGMGGSLLGDAAGDRAAAQRFLKAALTTLRSAGERLRALGAPPYFVSLSGTYYPRVTAIQDTILALQPGLTTAWGSMTAGERAEFTKALGDAKHAMESLLYDKSAVSWSRAVNTLLSVAYTIEETAVRTGQEIAAKTYSYGPLVIAAVAIVALAKVLG